MTYQPTMVITIDGREVLSDSEEWRATCEAVWVLSNKAQDKRSEWLTKIESRRGRDARLKLELEMNRLEPAYLLAMSSKDARRAYLAQTERHRGKITRDALESRIVALWEQRKAATTAAA